MKASVLVVACAVVTCWALSTHARELRRPAAASGSQATGLPGSLARLYPPAAPEPVYLQRMLGLSAALSGIAADVLEADVDNARAGLERFERQYTEVAGLVPEWASRFPTQPLEALGSALAAGDKGRCMEAIGALGATCHACHLDTMVPVQQALRWRSFTDITCQDQESGETLGYVQLMRDLDLGMSGIAADVAQGQVLQALAYFGLFRDRFDQLEQTCLPCHAGKREYYVDESVRAQVERLGTALQEEPIDAERVMSLLQNIGEKSCGRCHLVHMPAAMAHARGGR